MFRRFIQILDPNTRRRLRRFGSIGRAKWSLVALFLIFIISLLSNFIANDKPLIVRANGKLYFPVVKFYPEGAFTGSEVGTRPRYKQLERTPMFAEDDKNWMLWPLVKYGPEESLGVDDIEIDQTLIVTITPADQVATVDIDEKGFIQRSRGAAGFYGEASETALRRIPIESAGMVLPEVVSKAIEAQFRNEATTAISAMSDDGIEFQLRGYSPRSRVPKLVRLSMVRRAVGSKVESGELTSELTWVEKVPSAWTALSEIDQARVLDRAREALEVPQKALTISGPDGNLSVSFDRETIAFPFRPVREHWLGLDNSGRDVGVRILYATRTALLFGIILAIVSYVIGIVIGAIQGYFGGKVDMFGQRAIEIWEAMPFLLIMIFLSSIYGRGFFLLLFVYGIFNWIGISYYIRAEFLRLRKQPFVEAARVMGIRRWRVMFQHIFPNALVPVITFFPFALVGAIFALTSLDYLGFGLPPGTASWGDLLNQGQVQPYAWWLVLYPAIALFIVSLLGIFIGEGVRAAFDPKTHSKLE